MKEKILFLGEMPPKVIHGISISNQFILNTLSKKFKICIIEDNSSITSRILTILKTPKLLFELFKESTSSNILYINMPTSRFGLIRSLLLIKSAKIANKNIKIVTHLHRGDFLNFIKSKLNKYISYFFLKSINKILVLSRKSQDELTLTALTQEDKIKIIHNTVQLNIEKDITSTIDTTESNFYCLCNYIPTKNIHSLVKIANEIKTNIDFNGVIFNKGYMYELNKINTNDFCYFGEAISGQFKNEKIKKSKALILPSLNEGMPLVILESLALGTPIICYNVGYISEYLGEDYPGLVNNFTEQALMEKIKYFNSLTKSEYLLLKTKSLNLFWNNYSPEIISRKIINTFNKI